MSKYPEYSHEKSRAWFNTACLLASALHYTDSGKQFFNRKRLRQIIVCAGIKRHHLVMVFFSVADHNNGHL